MLVPLPQVKQSGGGARDEHREEAVESEHGGRVAGQRHECGHAVDHADLLRELLALEDKQLHATQYAPEQADKPYRKRTLNRSVMRKLIIPYDITRKDSCTGTKPYRHRVYSISFKFSMK